MFNAERALCEARDIVHACREILQATTEPHAISYERGRVEARGQLAVAIALRIEPESQLHRLDLALYARGDVVQVAAFGPRAIRLAEYLDRTDRIDGAYIAAKYVAGTWSLIEMRSPEFAI